jgi:Gcd10p family
MADSNTIIVGSQILLQGTNGNYRMIRKLKESETYRIGKAMVPGTALIGLQYGSTICDNADGTWKRVRPTRVGDIETEDETEELSASPEEAVTSRAMESAINSVNFAVKSKFAQEKYLVKKHKKFAREVTAIRPSLIKLTELEGSALRWDAICLLLRYGNISEGCTSLIFDDSGSFVAACLERGAKVCRLIEGKGTNSNKICQDLGINLTDLSVTELESLKDETNDLTVLYDSLILVSTERKCLQSLIDIAIKRLTDQGGLLAIYTRDMEEALKLQKQFRFFVDSLINVKLTEIFFREHQILSQRTHPIMTSQLPLFQGFVVSAIKIKQY